MKHYLSAGGPLLLAAMLAPPVCFAQEDGNNATAIQTGTGNRAYVGQAENERDAIALVAQNGTNNIAGDPVSQTGGITQFGNGPVRAEIRQTGNANRATATQVGSGFTWALQEQSGTANLSAVQQNQAYETVTRVAQTGAYNQVAGDAADTLTNGFTATQAGNHNTLSVYNRRNGFSNSYSDQNGTANQIAIDQTFSDYTSHSIAQLGERNRVTAVSNGSVFSGYSITQNGTGNVASTRTSAYSGSGDVQQTGERNLATTDQQGGNFNSSSFTVTQNGSLNTASLYQNGAIDAELGNVATIRQTGQRLNANLAQTGGGNQGVIVQQ